MTLFIAKVNHSHERRRFQQAIAKILGVDPRKEAEKIVAKLHDLTSQCKYKTLVINIFVKLSIV